VKHIKRTGNDPTCALLPQAKPKNLSDEQWVDLVNDTIIKVAGLDEQLGPGEEEGGADYAENQGIML
jgi:hypothetical protein